MSESDKPFEPPKLTKRSVKTHPLYSRWQSMTRRCRDPHDDSYPWYGARGIKVCERWRRSFPAFLADVGHPPTAKHSLHRIDRDGDYEPGNVRWVDPVTRNRLRRGTAPVREVTGWKTLFLFGWTCAEVARYVGRPYQNVHQALSGRTWKGVPPALPSHGSPGRLPEIKRGIVSEHSARATC